MIDKMMEQHKARRNQLQNEEMFEPIEIDFGYEDAVAFDSDKGKLLLRGKQHEVLIPLSMLA